MKYVTLNIELRRLPVSISDADFAAMNSGSLAFVPVVVAGASGASGKFSIGIHTVDSYVVEKLDGFTYEEDAA